MLAAASSHSHLVGIVGDAEVPPPLLREILQDQFSAHPRAAFLVDSSRDDLVGVLNGLGAHTATASVDQVIVQLLKHTGTTNLLVLLDHENPALESLVRIAQRRMEVRNIADVVTQLAPQEEAIMAVTVDELVEMEDEQLYAMCDRYGVPYEDSESWEEIIPVLADVINAASEESETVEEPVAAATDEEDDGVVYTREQLMEMPRDEIKALCVANEIEVPGAKPRQRLYVAAVLAAQGDEEATAEIMEAFAKSGTRRPSYATASPDEEEVVAPAMPAAAQAVTPTPDVVTLINEYFEGLRTHLASHFVDLTEKIEEVGGKLSGLSGELVSINGALAEAARERQALASRPIAPTPKASPAPKAESTTPATPLRRPIRRLTPVG